MNLTGMEKISRFMIADLIYLNYLFDLLNFSCIIDLYIGTNWNWFALRYMYFCWILGVPFEEVQFP